MPNKAAMRVKHSTIPTEYAHGLPIWSASNCAELPNYLENNAAMQYIDDKEEN